MDPKLVTDWIIAIGTAVAALASVLLLIVAIVQLRGLRDQIKQATDQERRRNTLAAIQRVEGDAPIKGARGKLWEASDNGTDYTKLTSAHEFDAVTLLNYLEGVAIGIEQDIYVEKMAKDYLKEIVHKAFSALIKGESGDGWKATTPMFPPSDSRV